MSKKTISEIATNTKYVNALQRLTRNVYLYDLDVTKLHVNIFYLSKIDELDYLVSFVQGINSITEQLAFQYYDELVKSAIDNNFFTLKNYMSAVLEGVSSEYLDVARRSGVVIETTSP